MANHFFEITFSSDIYKIRGILQDIILFLKKSVPNINTDDLNDLRLIFSELLCNATIHGNKQDREKSVHLYIKVQKKTVYARITDEGPGFDYITLLSEARSEESLTKDHGRGILLVYSLTDSLAFNITGNEIKFYKRVNTDGQNTRG